MLCERGFRRRQEERKRKMKTERMKLRERDEWVKKERCSVSVFILFSSTFKAWKEVVARDWVNIRHGEPIASPRFWQLTPLSTISRTFSCFSLVKNGDPGTLVK